MGSRRALAVSFFCAGHVVAILWWNAITVPPPRATAERAVAIAEAWASAREGVRAHPVGAALDGVLAGYVRASTTWQQWYLFGPDPPKHAATVRIYGIRRVGQNVALDPEPLFELDDVELDDQRLRLASQPCGFETSDDPRAVYLRGAWTRYVVRERVKAQGYVGARLVCSISPLPAPGETPRDDPPQDLVLWEGPL